MDERAEPTAADDLAATWNANRAAEAADAKQGATSAFEQLLQQPFGSGDTGKSAAKEGLDYLLDKWDELMRVGGHLITTKMVRKGLGSAAEAALIMALGRALRVDPIVALNNIYVVNNKPTCESKLLAGLIFREHGPNAIRYVDLTDERAVIDFTRSGGETQRFIFTMDDAERAGLAKKGGVWAQYPQFMLRHRCMSMGGNAVFPDVTCGMITPEEVGLAVKVDDDGNVTVDQSQIGKPPAAKAAKADPEPDEADAIRGPIGFWIREIRDERAEGSKTRRELLLREWPDHWVLVSKSKFEKYAADGPNEWKNAGVDRPGTCTVTDGKHVRQTNADGEVVDEIWFLGETLRHPAATGAIEVPGFHWQEEANEQAGAPRPIEPEAPPPPSREHTPKAAKGDDPVADAMWEANDAGKRLIASHSASREATLRAEVYGRDEGGAANTHFGTPDAVLLLEFRDKANALIREKGAE